jgi:multiple sugar transport system substrate-binding protein
MEGAGEDLMPEPNTRREFLRMAAGAALAAAATGAACGSGGGAAKPDRPPNGKGSARPAGDRTLRIAQLSHFVPTYDQWLDQEYSKRWGEDHGVQVVIDHFAYEELPARADAEVAAHGPHDIFAFADFWTANPTHYRVDLWNQVEPRLSPRSWDDVLRAAPVLKAMGHPVGIGFSSNPDSNASLFSLLHAFGASVQGEEGDVAINSPATVQAVKMGAAIFQAGMTDEVFLWDSPSNNRFLASRQGAMIVNAISAIRAVEDQNPELAEKIALAPLPAGPTGSLGPPSLMGLNVIWKFSGNQETAKQFLVDRALNYRDAFVRSGFYNLPAFPGAIPDLVELVGKDPRAKPSDKYALLAGATQWSTNLGHPGHANAPMDEVFNQFLVPKMFAAAARREMTADEAVKAAEAQMRPIFDKWRERGKI